MFEKYRKIREGNDIVFQVSYDDGKTWRESTRASVPEKQGIPFAVKIEKTKGRLVLSEKDQALIDSLFGKTHLNFGNYPELTQAWIDAESKAIEHMHKRKAK